jgi:hypothetical protein
MAWDQKEVIKSKSDLKLFLFHHNLRFLQLSYFKRHAKDIEERPFQQVA